MIIASIIIREHLRTEFYQDLGDYISQHCKQGSGTDKLSEQDGDEVTHSARRCCEVVEGSPPGPIRGKGGLVENGST